MKISLYSRFEMPAQAELAWADLLKGSAENGDLAAIYPSAFPQENSVAVERLGLVSGQSPLAEALLEWGTTNSLVEGLPDYLTRGQGIPDAVGQDTVAALRRGCAVLAIQCPSGLLGEYEISQILSLHHGKCFGRSGSYGKPSAPR